MLPVLPLDIIDDYLNNILSNQKIQNVVPQSPPPRQLTLSVFHIIVGSYMSENDITTPYPQYKRNHEYPTIVKNIFQKIDSQCSPLMMEYISHYDEITINQHLLLIDPMYKTEKSYYGLNANFPNVINDGKYVLEYDISHNDFKNTKIKSNLEPVVIPESILKTNLYDMIDIIMRYQNDCHSLINIIDCTSNNLLELYAHNDNPYVYISTPDCLLCDDKLQYMPIITLETLPDKPIRMSKIRWVNYNLDKSSILELSEVSDFCPYAKNTCIFLKTLYKTYAINIAFIAIYKILGLLSITKAYVLRSDKMITFKDMMFNDMVHLINRETGFLSLMVNCFDPYYEYQIRKYILTIINDESILAKVQNNTLLKEILLQDAINIINQLNEYFPDNQIILPSRELMIIRDKIREYIQANGVYM